MKVVKGLAALAAVPAAAGCLQPPDAGTASYGYIPGPQQGPSFVDYARPGFNQPPHYLPPIYQPPPLSPNLTPETVPMPAVGHSPQVRYLPAPSPPASLLGPQRPGWN